VRVPYIAGQNQARVLHHIYFGGGVDFKSFLSRKKHLEGCVALD
jgi:hypothetical protein